MKKRTKKASASQDPRKNDELEQESRALPGALGQFSSLMALEPRFMFDAAVAAAAEAVVDAVPETDGGGYGGDGDGDGDGDGYGESGNDLLFSPFGGISTLSGGYGDPNKQPEIDLDDIAATGNEDELIPITGIEVSDPEGDTLRVTLAFYDDEGNVDLEKGRLFLELAYDSGVEILLGTDADGKDFTVGSSATGYAKITIEGQHELVNEALKNLFYKGPENFYNVDASNTPVADAGVSLSISVIEARPEYAAWHDAAEDTIDITVKSVNDLPEVEFDFGSSGTGWTVPEDLPLHFGVEGGSGLEGRFTFSDADGDDLTVSFMVENGTLTFLDETGLNKTLISDGKGGHWAKYTFTGSQDEVNALVKGMTYQGNLDYNGEDVLHITASDGIGAEQSWDVKIEVSMVDDPPVYDADGDQFVVDEGGWTVITEDHIVLSDVDNTNNQIVLKVESIPGNGELQMKYGGTWTKLGVGATFTYDDIISGKVRYLHSGDQVREDLFAGSTSDSIVFSVDNLTDTSGASLTGGKFTLDVDITPVNQEPEISPDDRTSSVYEGQVDAPIKFTVTDPDQDSTVGHTVKVESLPRDGTLYYKDSDSSAWIKVVVGTELDMSRVKDGYLVYHHNGIDGAAAGAALGGTRDDGFRVTVKDDGGGLGEAGSVTSRPLDIIIEVKSANDNPYYATPPVDGVIGNVSVGSGYDDVVVTGILDIKDADSLPSSLTYTLKTGSYNGKLYFRSWDPALNNGAGGYTYREIGTGSSFTQADINAGSIVYIYYGGFGTKNDVTGQWTHKGTDHMKFTVRDSALSVLDPDGYLVGTAYEGGYGEFTGYTETGGDVVDGVLVGADRKGGTWKLNDVFIDFNVDYTHGTGTWTPPTFPIVGEGVVKENGDRTGTVFEGGQLVLTDDDLHAYLESPVSLDGVPQSPLVQEDPGITYRIAGEGQHGSLWYREYTVGSDGTITFTGKVRELGVNDPFTQRDVNAGAIYYQHDGSENFNDTISFTISNGTVEYKEGNSNIPTEISFTFKVVPLNDQPTLGGEITVAEGPTDAQRADGESGFADLGVALDRGSLGISDVDGSNGTPNREHDNTDYASGNDLTFIIVERPGYGDIYLYTNAKGTGDRNDIGNWEKVVYLTDEASLADAHDATWSTSTLGDTTILTMADLDAGNIRYIHDGSEVFQDAIRVIANDGRGVDFAPGHIEDGETVAAGTSYIEGDVFPGYWDNGVWVPEVVVGAGGLTVTDNIVVGGKWVNGSSTVTSNSLEGNNGNPSSGPNQSSISEIGVIKVNITPVNDKVIFENNTGMTVSFGDTAIDSVTGYVNAGGDLDDIRITKDMLSWKDDDAFDANEDFDPEQIMYVIKTPSQNGTVYVKNSSGEWIPAREGTVFTQADINSGNVVYLHFGVEHDVATNTGKSEHNDSFTFTVYDGDPTKVHTATGGADHKFVIGVEMANAGPSIIPGDNAQKDYFIDKPDGLKLNGFFKLDDADYYYGAGAKGGISNDYMQIIIKATKDTGGAAWGSFDYDSSIVGLEYVDSGEGFLVLRGTRDVLQQALDSVTFLPKDNPAGAFNSSYGDIDDYVNLSVTLNDLANGAKGTTQTKVDGTLANYDDVVNNGLANAKEVTSSITVMVSPINDKPNFFPDNTNTIPYPDGSTVNQYTVNEDAPAFDLTYSNGDSLYIYDPDHFKRNINEVTITCDLGTLGFSGSVKVSGVTGVLDSNGTYTLTFRGTNEAINEALALLTYKPRADVTGSDTVKIVYMDGDTVEWGTGTDHAEECHIEIDVTINPVNDTPVLTAPVEPIVIGTAGGAALVQGPNGEYIVISDPKDDPANGGYWQTGPEKNFTVVIKAVEAGKTSQWGTLDVDSAYSAMITNPGTGEITLTGTIDEINAALETLKFTPGSGTEDTKVELLISVDDDGNGWDPSSGNTTSATASGKVTIIVNDTNDAPEIKPGTGITNGGSPEIVLDEDGSFLFDAGSNNGISIDDPDALGYPITVTLTVPDGKLSFTTGSKDGKAYGFTKFDSFTISADGKTITMTASQSKINDALADLKYTPNADWNGKTTLTVTANDNGYTDATGNNNPQTDTLDILITVNHMNDAPSLDGKSPNAVISADPIVEDIASGSNQGQTVEDLFGNYFKDSTDSRNGTWVKDGVNPDGSTSNAFIGIWVTDVPASNGGKGTWEYSVDGTNWSTITTDMFLRADAKVRFQPDANYNSQSDSTATNNLGTVGRLTVRLVESEMESDGTESLDTLCNGLASGYTFSAADKAAGGLLQRDGENRYTDPLKLGITVKAVNDGPSAVYGGTTGDTNGNRIEVDEDTGLTFSTGTGNAIVFDDIDFNERTGGNVTVTLSVDHGTLTLGGTTGLTFENGTTNGSGTITITGSIADINAAVNGLVYKGTSNYNGHDEITVTISDNGYSDAKGQTAEVKTDGTKVYIDIKAVDDAPTSSANEKYATGIVEDTPLANGQTVNDLFGGLFSDAADNQYNSSTNVNGSESDVFVGVWVKENQNATAMTDKGIWTYSTNGGTTWSTITGGMFLSKDTLVRFEPAQDFNTETDATSGNPKGDAPALTVRLVESEDSTGTNSLASDGTLYTLSDLTRSDGTLRYTGEVALKTVVKAANDGPSATYGASGSPGESGGNRIEVNEDTGLTFSTGTGNAIVFDDIDFNERTGGKVTVTLSVDHGTLTLGGTTGLTFENGTTNGSGTITITGSIADINAAVNGLVYKGTSNYNGHDEITVTISDNGYSDAKGQTAEVKTDGTKVYIDIKAVDDAPTSSANEKYATGIVEDTPLANGQTVNDLFGGLFSDTADNQYNSSTNPDGSKSDVFVGVWVKENQNATDMANKGTWTYSTNGGTTWVTITGGMFLNKDTLVRFKPVQDFNTETDATSGNPKGDAPALTVRLVESEDSTGTNSLATGGTAYTLADLTRSDGTLRYTGEVALKTVVKAANDGPSAVYGGTTGDTNGNRIEVDEDTGLTFSTGNSNAIIFSDIDYNERDGGNVTVTLSVDHGTLTLGGTTGLTFENGTANGSGTITITGSITDINAAVNGLVYKGASNYYGHDEITVTISDNGYSDAKGQTAEVKTDGTKVYIQVSGVNDAPEISDPNVDNEVIVLEDGSLCFNGAGTTITISDQDINDGSGTDSLSVTVSVGNGTLVLASGTGVSASGGYTFGDAATSITFTGTQAQVNAALKALTYAPDADWNGDDTLTVQVTDSNSGLIGNAESASKTVTLKVVDINDAPEVIGTGEVTLPAINEDASNPPGQSVSGLFGSSFDDSADTVPGGSSANNFAGVVIVGNSATDSAKGDWEYTLDGSTWVKVPTNVSNSNAIYLPPGALLRFLPTADFNGVAPELTVRLVDDSAVDSVYNAINTALPSAGATGLNLVNVGTTTRYSADTITLKHTVNAVNDSPVVDGASGGTVVNDELGVIHGYSPITGDSSGTTVSDLFGDYFNDAKDQQKSSGNPSGSEQNDFAGVLITETTPPSTGDWYYSTDGNTWTKITVSPGQGLLLSGDALLKFTPNADPSNVGEGSASLTGRLVDSSGGAITNGDTVTLSTAPTTNVTDRYSEDSVVIKTYIGGPNSAPTIVVDPTRTVNELGIVQVAPGGSIADPQLDRDAGTKWYDVTLSVGRKDGASAEDHFVSYNTGVLGELVQGGNVVLNGETVGTVTKNSGGELKIVFNDNATKAKVNDVLTNIGYYNDSHNPPAQVTLVYDVGDGNAEQFGRQGDGADMHGTAEQVITINPIADDPVAVDDFGRVELTQEGDGQVGGNVLSNDYDPDGTALHVTPDVIVGTYGTLTLNADGTYTYTVDASNPAVSELRPGETLSESFTYTMGDANGGMPDSATLTIEIVNANSDHVVESEPIRPGDSSGDEPRGPVGEAGDPPTPIHDVVTEITNNITENADNFINTINDVVSSYSPGSDVLYDLDRTVWSDEITLVANPDNRNLYINYMQEFELPETMFLHSNPSEKLSFEAVMGDGSPLPEWLYFDADSLSFRANPPDDVEGLFDVVILARDSKDCCAKAVLTVFVRRQEELDIDNGIRNPDRIQAVRMVDETEVAENEEVMVEEAVLEEALDEGEPEDDVLDETLALLDDASGEALELPSGMAASDEAGFSGHVARVGNTGLWIRSLELVEAVGGGD